MKRLWLYCILLCVAAACSAGVEFYVSPGGDDSAEGSLRSPWATPEFAVKAAAEYSATHPGERVTVLFDGGEYRLDSVIRIEGLRSPLTLRAMRGRTPVFCGDADVDGWREYRDGIIMADLRACGVTDYGNPIRREDRIDFYADGLRQELARWPNGTGFSYLGKALGPTFGIHTSFIGDIRSHNEGIMQYVDKRMDRWAEEKDPYILGYWYWDWYEEYKSISCIDTVAKTFVLDPLGHMYGYNDGPRVFGVNLFCELDSPGEYYVDREDGVIYWYPPEGGFVPGKTRTRVSVFPGEVMLAVNGCDGFTLEGIELRGGRGGAVSIRGGSNNAVRKCNISRFAEPAVIMEGGFGHKIISCHLSQLGASGILATGGDRHSLESSGFVFRGNVVEDFALFKHTYEPAIRFEGVGARICRNEFRNSTSSAVSLKGNDILVQFNRFSDLVRESDDQGALESFGDLATRRLVIRFNRWENINGGTKYGAAAVRFDDFISGNRVYGNVFDHCGSFRFGAVQIHGGRDNIVHGNLFKECNFAVSCSPWTYDALLVKYERFKSRWEDIDLYGDLYTSRYPELLEPLDSLNHNRNFVRNNIIVRTPRLFRNGENLVTKGNVTVPGRSRSLPTDGSGESF